MAGPQSPNLPNIPGMELTETGNLTYAGVRHPYYQGDSLLPTQTFGTVPRILLEALSNVLSVTEPITTTDRKVRQFGHDPKGDFWASRIELGGAASGTTLDVLMQGVKHLLFVGEFPAVQPKLESGMDAPAREAAIEQATKGSSELSRVPLGRAAQIVAGLYTMDNRPRGSQIDATGEFGNFMKMDQVRDRAVVLQAAGARPGSLLVLTPEANKYPPEFAKSLEGDLLQRYPWYPFDAINNPGDVQFLSALGMTDFLAQLVLNGVRLSRVTLDRTGRKGNDLNVTIHNLTGTIQKGIQNYRPDLGPFLSGKNATGIPG